MKARVKARVIIHVTIWRLRDTVAAILQDLARWIAPRGK